MSTPRQFIFSLSSAGGIILSRPLLCLLCVVALQSGCGSDSLLRPLGLASAEKAPEWFLHPPHEAGWLYAVGAAGPHEVDTALAKARQDLVSQLSLTIRSTSMSNESYSSQEATGQGRAERLAQAARNNVQTHASANDLPGVQVIERVEQTKNTYVLLRLDRKTWAADLRMRIADLDARLLTEAATVSALPTATPAQRLTAAGTHIRRLLPLLVERDECLTRLRIALPSTAMPPDVVNRATLDNRLENLLADLTVSLPADPSVKPLESQLINSLRAVGLHTVPAGTPGILTLPLTLTTRSETISGQIRLDGQLNGSLALSPDAGGTQLGGISISERASSTREDVAKERLFQKLAKALADDLDKRLTRMLAGN